MQAAVDHCSHSQGAGITTQEGDIPALRQTLEAVADVVQRFVEEGFFFKDVMEVKVEQSDA